MLSNCNDRYAKLVLDCGFHQYFDLCLFSCETGVKKPNKEAYQVLLQSTKYSPKEIVFIDDKRENVEASKKLGLDAVLFESSYQIRKELMKRELPTKKKGKGG